MRGRMSALSILCKRFATVLRMSDIETFLNVGRLYPEISPLEKHIDMHIDLLKRDEFNVMGCVDDISKSACSFFCDLISNNINLLNPGFMLHLNIWQNYTSMTMRLIWSNASWDMSWHSIMTSICLLLPLDLLKLR